MTGPRRWRMRTPGEHLALMLGKELLRKRSMMGLATILNDSDLDVAGKVVALRSLGDSQRTAFNRSERLAERKRKPGCWQKPGPKP